MTELHASHIFHHVFTLICFRRALDSDKAFVVYLRLLLTVSTVGGQITSAARQTSDPTKLNNRQFAVFVATSLSARSCQHY